MGFRNIFCCTFITIAVLLLAIDCKAQSIPDVNPADYGLNCTLVEFLSVYLGCLTTYNSADVIVNCQIQCSALDVMAECIRGFGDKMSTECVTSLAHAMVNVPQPLRELLFDSGEVQGCGLEVNSVLDVCPQLPSLVIPAWAPSGQFGSCNDQCVEVRTRECLNTISFRPPEPVDGCTGDSIESRPCETVTCTTNTATVSATGPPAAGIAFRNLPSAYNIIIMGVMWTIHAKYAVSI